MLLLPRELPGRQGGGVRDSGNPGWESGAWAVFLEWAPEATGVGWGGGRGAGRGQGGVCPPPTLMTRSKSEEKIGCIILYLRQPSEIQVFIFLVCSLNWQEFRSLWKNCRNVVSFTLAPANLIWNWLSQFSLSHLGRTQTDFCLQLVKLCPTSTRGLLLLVQIRWLAQNEVGDHSSYWGLSQGQLDCCPVPDGFPKDFQVFRKGAVGNWGETIIRESLKCPEMSSGMTSWKYCQFLESCPKA